MAVHTLTSLTWPAVRDLPPERTVAVLPAGATEAHGPHLPLGTDVIIAEAMARAGADRLAARGLHVLLLPSVALAPAPFASAFAGTLHTPARATTMMVTGVVRSLEAHGIRLTAIANAHHDPAHVSALRAAVDEIAASAGATLVFPDLTRRRWAERLTDEFRSGACHAGRYEGSIVLAERPDLVRRDVMATLPANPRSLVDAIRRDEKTFAEAGGADAYFGFPADATAEEGRDIVATLGAILEEAVMAELDGVRAGSDPGYQVNGVRPQSDPVVALAPVNPPELGSPRGFAHGTLAPAGGRLLFVAGQTATNADGRITSAAFVDQFDGTLARVLTVVRAAGGHAGHIARMTVYVTSMHQYRESRPLLRDVWQRHMGTHYPAMALVQVTSLVDEGAAVEIEATAVLP
jgi:creatinine amidohydrolase